MSYWNGSAEGSDFATNAVGVAILNIKDKMLKDFDGIMKAKHPEQSIITSLTCLRLIGERFPQSLCLHFLEQDYIEMKEKFYQWFELMNKKIPAKYRDELKASAEQEFMLFEKTILKR